MMIDLKPYLDAVNAAADEVQRIASEIDALFTEGTDESKIQALELRPSLEEAQSEHLKQLALYETMQKANRPNDIAKNFVPVSTTQPEQTDGTQPTVIKRPEYNAMDLVQRARFIKSGGTVED
jgi:ElaB/YqjD/DUF883 family membrane-anchored ribosome-binding protein